MCKGSNFSFFSKYIFFFLLYFLVHYLEGLPSIGAFSFAQFWKIPVLLYLLLYTLRYVGRRPVFEKASYGLSVEYFFSPEVLLSPLRVLIAASKQLPLVLFFRYWILRYGLRSNVLQTVLYSFAQYICISAIPLLLGLIEPLQGSISAEAFGIEGLVYFSGVFGSPHAAASYFCVAILVLLHGFFIGRFKTRKAKCLNVLLILVAVVAILKSYVRTGWLMLFVGIFSLLDFSKVSFKRWCMYLGIGFFVVFGVVYLYKTNEAFHARLTGVNIYSGTGGDKIELSGSGRVDFWVNGISNWTSNDFYQLLFGSGYTKVLEDNYAETGMRVFSHNQFVDALAQNGLFGFLLLVLFYAGVYVYVYTVDRQNPYRKLALSIFWASLIFSFFQNEMYFDFAIVFSLVLALCSIPLSREVKLFKPCILDK